MDYRDLAGERFDAIASIGMVEHVGASQIDVYAERLAGLLQPGGRLLNHGIARLRHTDPEAGPFSERYVFPDAEPLHLSRVLLALERAGFVTAPRRGVRRRLRRDPAPLGAAPRRAPRRGGAPRRAGAGARLAPLSARRAQRLRDRLHSRSTKRAAASPEAGSGSLRLTEATLISGHKRASLSKGHSRSWEGRVPGQGEGWLTSDAGHGADCLPFAACWP